MTNSHFSDEALRTFAGAYPNQCRKLSHNVAGHPLFGIERMAALAAALPTESVEYNSGDLPIGIAPEDIPPQALGVSDTILTIEKSNSWVVLKRIEQDPAYAALLASILNELEPIIGARTGEMLGMEGFIFISSPDAITPFHFDPEHNVLLQIRGSKTMTVFPAGDERFADERVHEDFHLGKHHRNLAWQDHFAQFGETMALMPGEALYVPVKAPHWVQNGPAVSISLSVTWRSKWTYAEADARAFNHMLRRLGFSPKRPAPYPNQNLAKSIATRAIRKAHHSVKSLIGAAARN